MPEHNIFCSGIFISIVKRNKNSCHLTNGDSHLMDKILKGEF